MLEYAMMIGAIGGGIGAVFAGWARLKMAEAAKIWAGRADPLNEHVLRPSDSAGPPR